MPIAMEHASPPEFRQHTYISASEAGRFNGERLGLEMSMYEAPYAASVCWGTQIWRAAAARVVKTHRGAFAMLFARVWPSLICARLQTALP